MMTLGLGLALGAPVGGAAAPAPNPNLLLWTDELDNAVWIKTLSTVSADQDGVADEWASLAINAAARQITTAAAATGGPATATMAPGQLGAYVHGEVSGTFSGATYTFSMMAKDTGVAATPQITMRLDILGGFLRCSIEDGAGDGDYLVQHFQLEVGPFTSYQHRGGS